MTSKPRKVHWGWLPAAIIFNAGIWVRLGPVVAILSVLAGLGLAMYAERKAARRRSQNR
jgi:hypothetical protein